MPKIEIEKGGDPSPRIQRSSPLSIGRKVAIVVASLFFLLGLAGAVVTGGEYVIAGKYAFWLSISGAAAGLMSCLGLIIWEVLEAKKGIAPVLQVSSAADLSVASAVNHPVEIGEERGDSPIQLTVENVKEPQDKKIVRGRSLSFNHDSLPRRKKGDLRGHSIERLRLKPPTVNQQKLEEKDENEERAEIPVIREKKRFMGEVGGDSKPKLPTDNDLNSQKKIALAEPEEPRQLRSLSVAIKNFLNNPQMGLDIVSRVVEENPSELSDCLFQLLQQKKWREHHLALFTELVRAAKKRGSVNASDNKGNRALHYATTIEQAKQLIDAGASLDIKNHAGKTPLHVNLRSYKPPSKLFCFLIEKATLETVNLADSQGYCPIEWVLWYALNNNFYIDQDWVKIFKILLKKGASIQSSLTNKPLMGKLIEKYSQSRTKKLFQKIVTHAQKSGCLNTQDSDGNTLLHKIKNFEQAKIVICAGASLGIRNYNNITPLHQAIIHEQSWSCYEWFSLYLTHARAEDLVIEDDKGNLLLHQWILRGHAAKTRLRRLISLPNVGSIIDLANRDGETLLHQAFRMGDMDSVSILLKYASLAKADNQKITPLHLAFSYFNQHSNEKLAKQILMKLTRSDAAYHDQNGNSWLHILAMNQTSSYYMADRFSFFIIQLIKLGVDPNALNNQGQRAVDLAKNRSDFQKAIDQAAVALQTPLSEKEVFKIIEYSQNTRPPLLHCLSNWPYKQEKAQKAFLQICMKTNAPYTDLFSYLFDQFSEDDWFEKNAEGKTVLQVILTRLILGDSNKELMECWENLCLKFLNQKPSLLLKAGESTLIHWLLKQHVENLPIDFFDQILELTHQQGYLDFQDRKGNTPLLLALGEKKYPQAQKIIAKGADPTLTNQRGKKAISIMMRRNEPNILAALLTDDLIYSFDEEGNNLLHHAAYYNNVVAIKLLKRKIPLAARNRSGSNPLHVALKRGATDAIKALIPLLNNHTILCVDNEHQTYLHLVADLPASCSPHYYLIKFLEKGLDPRMRNRSRKTAEQLLVAQDPKAANTIKLFSKFQPNPIYINLLENYLIVYSRENHDQDLKALDLAPETSREELKKGYHKYALLHHPDRNKENDTTEKFKNGQAAYERLQKSRYFDQMGSFWTPPVLSPSLPPSSFTPFHESCKLREGFLIVKIEKTLAQLVQQFLKRTLTKAHYLGKIVKLLKEGHTVKYQNSTLLHWILNLCIEDKLHLSCCSDDIPNYAKIFSLLIEAAQAQHCLDLADHQKNTPFILGLTAAVQHPHLCHIFKPLIFEMMRHGVSIKEAIQSGLVYKMIDSFLEAVDLSIKFIEHAHKEGYLGACAPGQTTIFHYFLLNMRYRDIKIKKIFSLPLILKNLDLQDTNGETILHCAIKKHEYDLVKMLIEKGADLSIANKEGITPLALIAKDYLLCVYFKEKFPPYESYSS